MPLASRNIRHAKKQGIGKDAPYYLQRKESRTTWANMLQGRPENESAIRAQQAAYQRQLKAMSVYDSYKFDKEESRVSVKDGALLLSDMVCLGGAACGGVGTAVGESGTHLAIGPFFSGLSFFPLIFQLFFSLVGGREDNLEAQGLLVDCHSCYGIRLVKGCEGTPQFKTIICQSAILLALLLGLWPNG